jgi:hypothetical protein
MLSANNPQRATFHTWHATCVCLLLVASCWRCTSMCSSQSEQAAAHTARRHAQHQDHQHCRPPTNVAKGSCKGRPGVNLVQGHHGHLEALQNS